MGYVKNEAGLMTSWQVRQLGVLINIIDLPELPISNLNWSNEQCNRFEDLMDYAYNHELKEISWLDERVPQREAVIR